MNLVNNNTITQYFLILTNVFALNDQIFFFRVSSTHVECFQFWKEFMWSEIYLVQVQIWRFGANGSPAAACGWSLVVGGNIEATILNLDIISFLQFLHYTLNVFFFEILSVKGLFDPCITKYRLVEVSGSVFWRGFWYTKALSFLTLTIDRIKNLVSEDGQDQEELIFWQKWYLAIFLGLFAISHLCEGDWLHVSETLNDETGSKCKRRLDLSFWWTDIVVKCKSKYWTLNKAEIERGAQYS